MRWSLKLGKVAGIKIFMHWTFLLLLGWIFLVYWEMGNGLGMALYGVLFVLALFGCVVLHELGHALMARRYGIATQDITLLPIGGVARLERIPREPTQELLVAIAGPAVNVIIAALLFFGLWLWGLTPFQDSGATWRSFAGQLMFTNLFLVVFNLLPAFPMDGGRILRALLARRLEYTRATRIAARIGQVMAIGFGLLALRVNPMLLLIAIFVFLGAEAELRTVQITSPMRGLTVQQAMLRRFRALSAQDSLQQAASELLAGSQQDFPVVSGEEVVGVLARNDLVTALAERGPETQVGQALHPGCQVLSETDELERCYNLLRQNGCTSLPVVRDGRLIGMVTLENLHDWMLIQAALRQGEPEAKAA